MWNGTKVPGKMAWSDSTPSIPSIPSTPDWVKMVGSSGKSGRGGSREGGGGGGGVAPFYLPTEKQVVNVYVHV